MHGFVARINTLNKAFPLALTLKLDYFDQTKRCKPFIDQGLFIQQSHYAL